MDKKKSYKFWCGIALAFLIIYLVYQLIFSKEKQMIVGILIGAFAPNSGISLGGINPRELHQTTHCISTE